MVLKRRKHICNLPERDFSCLPKLPPRATVYAKIFRKFQNLFLLNVNHFKCNRIFRNTSKMIDEKRRHIATNPWVIHPLSSFSLMTNLTFFFVWSYVLLVRPLAVFSDHFNLFFEVTLHCVIVPIQVILIALLLNCGYIDSYNQIITDPRKIVTRYLKTYFVFDVASSFILVEVMEVLTKAGYVRCAKKTLHEHYCFEIVTVISILSGFVRVGTLLNYLKEILSHLGMEKVGRDCMLYIVKTFYYLHAIAFVFYLVPYLMYRGNWPHNSWLAREEVRHENPMFFQYFEALMMAVCFFFGIGYKTELHLIEEKIPASLVMVFGRLYTLYLLADVLNLFGVVSVSESIYEKRMKMLKEYMIGIEAPPVLKGRIVQYYQFKYQRRYFRENYIISTLSELLRTELFFHAASNMIKKVEVFKRLPSSVANSIIASMQTEIYSPQDVILDAGALENNIFFISSGTVSVLADTGKELSHLHDGHSFGTDCLISTRQLFTVVAVETTEVFIISKHELMRFLSDQSEAREAFVKSVKTQLKKLKDVEAKSVRGGGNILEELEKGNILEQATKRILEQ